MSTVISSRTRQLESLHERISTLMLDLTDEDEAKADQAFETLMTPKETPPKTRVQELTQNCAAWGLFIGSLFVMAAVFHSCEHDHEHALTVLYYEKKEKMASVSHDNMDIEEIFEWMEDHGNCVQPHHKDRLWDYWGSFLYALTVPTSIGYGNFAPQTTLGRLCTVLYSLFGMPLFVYCLGTSAEFLDGAFARLPGFPAKKAGKRGRTQRQLFMLLTYLLVLVLWIVLVAGLGLGIAMDWGKNATQRLQNGIYFGWITVTTIGLGDFVILIEDCRGLGVIFILVGLALFGPFLAHLVSWIESIRQEQVAKHLDLSKIRQVYSEEELTVVTTAFTVVDQDDSESIDKKELKFLLFLMGMETDDKEVEDLLTNHDQDMNMRISFEEWLDLMMPIATKGGLRAHYWHVISHCIIFWFCILVYVVIGGYVFVATESDHEHQAQEHFQHILDIHRTGLNHTQEIHMTHMVDHLVNSGICSVPTCEEYEYPEEPDMFECKRYHDDWGLQGSIFFSFTLVTTIGYGSFTPSTASGKWFTIFYSFFGILIFGHGVSLLLELPHSIHRYFQDASLKRCCNASQSITEERLRVKLEVEAAAQKRRQLREESQATDVLSAMGWTLRGWSNPRSDSNPRPDSPSTLPSSDKDKATGMVLSPSGKWRSLRKSVHDKEHLEAASSSEGSGWLRGISLDGNGGGNGHMELLQITPEETKAQNGVSGANGMNGLPLDPEDDGEDVRDGSEPLSVVEVDDDGMEVHDSWLYRALKVLEGTEFTAFVIAILFVEFGLLLDTSASRQHWSQLFSLSSSIFFLTEISFRMTVYFCLYGRISSFFGDNKLRIIEFLAVMVDCLSLLLSILIAFEAMPQAKGFRAVRLFRAVRYLRFIRLLRSSRGLMQLYQYRVYFSSVAIWSIIVVAFAIFNIVLLILYYDHWTFFVGAYFVWITWTTIGLGDFTPQHGHLMLSAIFIIVGLSLVTQFLGEIQEVIIRWRYGVIEPDDSKFRVETLRDVRERIHWRNMAVQERADSQEIPADRLESHRIAFEAADPEDRKALDYDRARPAMEAVCKAGGVNLSEEETRVAFEAADKNKDGLIDFPQFALLVEGKLASESGRKEKSSSSSSIFSLTLF